MATTKFTTGFKKAAFELGGKTINQLIGNPFGNAAPKPPTPPPAPKNVSAGKTLGQTIGFPGS